MTKLLKTVSVYRSGGTASYGLVFRIPTELYEPLGLQAGSRLSIELDGQRIILEVVKEAVPVA